MSTTKRKIKRSLKIQLTAMFQTQWANFGRIFPRLKKSTVWLFRIALISILIDTGYLIGIWPNWKWYTDGPFLESQFIKNYRHNQWQDRSKPSLKWQPIEWEKIPTVLIKAVLTAEDSKFYRHDGIDTEAFQKAMEYNWRKKEFAYGASTITQQTVKNLFLSPSRNPFRKWHEVVLTFAIERNLKKSRILNIYLNIAEFGNGIYGIEAAAKKYWGTPASNLTKTQAIELAATLPAPRRHNPKTRSRFFLKQVAKIKRNMG